jgi:uncharacterized membrane protein (DUF485 family)
MKRENSITLISSVILVILLAFFAWQFLNMKITATSLVAITFVIIMTIILITIVLRSSSKHYSILSQKPYD